MHFLARHPSPCQTEYSPRNYPSAAAARETSTGAAADGAGLGGKGKALLFSIKEKALGSKVRHFAGAFICSAISDRNPSASHLPPWLYVPLEGSPYHYQTYRQDAIICRHFPTVPQPPLPDPGTLSLNSRQNPVSA